MFDPREIMSNEPLELTIVASSLEIFDEYARRQFVTRAPSQNPFGTDEAPVAFNEFDAFTKVCVSEADRPYIP